jgi:hypothetical protein
MGSLVALISNLNFFELLDNQTYFCTKTSLVFFEMAGFRVSACGSDANKVNKVTKPHWKVL